MIKQNKTKFNVFLDPQKYDKNNSKFVIWNSLGFIKISCTHYSAAVYYNFRNFILYGNSIGENLH